MKKHIQLSGSIAKKETLVPIQSNVLENTSVAEAALPYANYYGQLPSKAKPNSLFLFTTKFYFLEDILNRAQRIDACLIEKINIASAIIEYKNKQYSAIRIKHFPDYNQISNLQSCLIKQGIEFAPKIHLQGEVIAHINKLFSLEELEADFFKDNQEENKGYFIYGNRMSTEEFELLMKKVKNNGNCKLFDAVRGTILRNGKVFEIVRVFSEGLDLALLKCVKNQIA